MRVVAKVMFRTQICTTLPRLVTHPVLHPVIYSFSVQQREKSSWQAPPKQQDPFNAHINQYCKGATEQIQDLKRCICYENPSFQHIKRVAKLLMIYQMNRKSEFKDMVRQKRRQSFPKEDRIQFMDQYFSFVFSTVQTQKRLEEEITFKQESILENLDLTDEDLDEYASQLAEDVELKQIQGGGVRVEVEDVRRHLKVKLIYAKTQRMDDIMQAAQNSLSKMKMRIEASGLFGDIMQTIYQDEIFQNEPSLDSETILLAYGDYSEEIAPELEQFDRLTAHLIHRINEIHNIHEI